MLIVKAYVNDKQIDEIHVWNTGICVNEDLQTYEYKIELPRGYEDFPIFHMRDLGWRVLAKQAIDLLESASTKLNKKKRKVKKEKKNGK